MNEWRTEMHGIVDSHVHMGGVTEEQSLLTVRQAAGVERMNLVCIQDPGKGEGLAQSLCMKARHPGVFYVFAGLNHAARLSDGRVKAPGLVAQANAFAAMGCDGIKMLEGKPTSRQKMNVPVTDAYFGDYWARVEELGTPIVWHVNDPEEFWDPARTPSWAKEHNWGYGPHDVAKEELYGEVDAVLAKHPRLVIIFAHFYFLSADLARAARFLDAHPPVCFDLAPGIEMLYNLSRDPAAARAFFVKYADRIVFGTDLFSNLTSEQAVARAGMVMRWLESSDTFRVSAGADFLLGPPQDGVIRGMSLPKDVLARIYRGNFERIAGSEPRKLDRGAAAEHCGQLAAIAQAMSGTPAADTEAGRVANRLADEA
jgi:hypothetical protein